MTNEYFHMLSYYQRELAKYGSQDFRSITWASKEGNGAKRRYEQIHSFIPFDNLKVLEVGCAFGSFFRLGYNCKKYLGIDVNENLVQIAKRDFPMRNFHTASLESFVFDDIYDLVIASGVFGNRYIPLNYPQVLKLSLQKMYESSNYVAVTFPSIFSNIRDSNIEYYSPEYILNTALSISLNAQLIHSENSDFLLILQNNKLGIDIKE